MATTTPTSRDAPLNEKAASATRGGDQEVNDHAKPAYHMSSDSTAASSDTHRQEVPVIEGQANTPVTNEEHPPTIHSRFADAASDEATETDASRQTDPRPIQDDHEHEPRNCPSQTKAPPGTRARRSDRSLGSTAACVALSALIVYDASARTAHLSGSVRSITTALVLTQLIILLGYCNALGDLIYFFGRSVGSVHSQFMQGVKDAQRQTEKDELGHTHRRAVDQAAHQLAGSLKILDSLANIRADKARDKEAIHAATERVADPVSDLVAMAQGSTAAPDEGRQSSYPSPDHGQHPTVTTDHTI